MTDAIPRAVRCECGAWIPTGRLSWLLHVLRRHLAIVIRWR